MTIASLIRPLTIVTIIGLLLSVGLKVNVVQIVEATRRPALVVRSLLANFVLAAYQNRGPRLSVKGPETLRDISAFWSTSVGSFFFPQFERGKVRPGANTTRIENIRPRSDVFVFWITANLGRMFVCATLAGR